MRVEALQSSKKTLGDEHAVALRCMFVHVPGGAWGPNPWHCCSPPPEARSDHLDHSEA